jgi:short-subunit dehydrogenase involved in D-alanine esterification of teichoic acids
MDRSIGVTRCLQLPGIAGASGQKTGNVDYESWAQVFNVNAMGPLRVVESFSDHIARSERRMVITITSGMGSLADKRPIRIFCSSPAWRQRSGS